MEGGERETVVQFSLVNFLLVENKGQIKKNESATQDDAEVVRELTAGTSSGTLFCPADHQ